MRKKIAGLVLAAGLVMGVGPLAAPAHANGNDNGGTTDPVLCFVAAHAIFTQALADYRAHHLTAAELRSVMTGTSVFLGDCLTPSS